MLSISHPIQIVMGLIIWSVWFVVLYGLQGIGCNVAPPAAELGPWTWINALLLGLGVCVTLLLLFAAYRCWKAGQDQRVEEDSHRRFIARISGGIYLFSAIAAAAVTVPVVIYPPCV
ncbi:hypothetical protein [Pseudomonas saliphila]|uniref:hypothetical protein n=1 Tax=Pseudomonas saliphila TaxID=2586906 RepID=UPI001238DE15|nr:hypothetical protein [Pseudomonas saliphila]